MNFFLIVILYTEMLLDLASWGSVKAFDTKRELLLKQYPQLNSTEHRCSSAIHQYLSNIT